MALQPHGGDSSESFAAALAFLDEALNDSSAPTQCQPAASSTVATSSLPALTEDDWDSSLLLESIGDFGEDAAETVTPLSPGAAATLATLSRQLQLGTDHFDDEGAENVSISRNSKRRKTTKPKEKKQQLGYDPNKARNGRRFEIIHLRKEAEEMELKLQQLMSMQEGENRRTGRELELVRSRARKTPAVWEEICNRQLERRLKSERDNALLKKKCEKGKQVARSIEKMVRKRLAQQGVELSDGDRPTRRVNIPPGFQSNVTKRIFEELMAGVDASYREIETVLGNECPSSPTRGLRDNAKDMQVNLSYSKIMPFDIAAVGDAWWRRWHNYKGQSANDNWINNTVTEKFGLEMRDARTNATATFYDQQILRRYVEGNRIVIVWRAYIEPLEFEKRPVNGMYFLEKGYVLIKPHDHDEDVPASGNDTFTRVSTCYMITPKAAGPKLRRDTRTTSLVDFVAAAVSANMSMIVEMVENMLLDQSIFQRKG